MIKQSLIRNILDLLLDGNPYETQLRQQLPFLNDEHYNYDGPALSVRFTYSDAIISFRLKTDIETITGVELRSTDLEAGTSLSISNGVIEMLELWSFKSEFPKTLPNSYLLTQGWEGAPGRRIEKK